MTTSPVMSINDELLAELESELGQILRIAEFAGGVGQMSAVGIGSYLRLVTPQKVLSILASNRALLAHIADLKADIKEYAEAFNKLAGSLARIAIGSGEIAETNNLDDLLGWLEPAIAERAELKRDADRYRWLRGASHFDTPQHRIYCRSYGPALDVDIDIAMQEAAP